jgi:hypothetical protein
MNTFGACVRDLKRAIKSGRVGLVRVQCEELGERMVKTKDELERILTGEVIDYLAVAESSDPDALAKREGPMCSTLGRLFTRRLEDKDNPPWGFWVDDMIPGWYGLSTFPHGLEFYGYAIWGDHSRQQWAAPAAVKVQVTPEGGSLANYRLDFGDARRGLTRLPLGQNHVKVIEMNRPETWLSTFTEESSAK